jgi:hypothetical protein
VSGDHRETRPGLRTYEKQGGHDAMRTAMWVVVALFALVLAREAPALRRYLKMRSM